MSGRSILRGLALVAVAASGSLAAAAPAVAGPPHFPRTVHLRVPAFSSLTAGVPASHGYRFELSGLYEGRVRGEAQSRPVSYLGISLHKGSTEAKYTLPAGVTPDGAVAASLGALGRIAVRFVPRQVTEEPIGPGCPGNKRIERGVLRGAIAFRGDGDYADLDATALPATLTTSPEALCTFHPNQAQNSHKEHESIRFGGQWNRGHGSFVDFTAYEHPHLGTATLRATAYEKRGPISVIRSAGTVVPARAAPFDKTAGTASVATAAPFTGSARFHAFPGKESGTWLGSLAVDFPGRPGFRLAGRRYEGSLLSGNECGPDDPGESCIGLKVPSPIALYPVRPAETPAPPER
jgi:hypothetical protein